MEMANQGTRQDQASDTGPQPISNSFRNLLDLAISEPVDPLAERERRHDIMHAMLKSAGQAFLDHNLTNWIATNPKQAAVKAALQEWWRTFPERRKAREGIVLYGPVGTGKDHLAFGAIGAAVMEHGCTAAFRNGRDLMAEVRDRIGAEKPEGTLIDTLTACDVLILSDPLPVRGELTDFQADVLYRLVDGRASEGRLTVCTLNVADDAEADRRLGAATWDRLCDRAWKLACFWPTYRKPAREIKP